MSYDRSDAALWEYVRYLRMVYVWSHPEEYEGILITPAPFWRSVLHRFYQ